MTSLATSEVHSRTIAAFFDTRDAANKAVSDLVAAGISRDQISVTAGDSTVKTSDEKGFWESLKDMFLPDEDRYAYTEGLRRGGVVVSVRTDDTYYDRALEILDDEGAVDLDEREATWRKEGWKGYEASDYAKASTLGAVSGGSTAYSATTQRAAGSASTSATAALGKDEVIPVYEEQLKVGKRDINQGRVRVRSYVVETPVSEQVSLRKESVQVERKSVDRPVGAADALFQDRVIEAEEHSEEAVIAKEARIKEEITLKKTAQDKTQTVSDTVRHTEVDVQDERVGGTQRVEETTRIDKTKETPRRP